MLRDIYAYKASMNAPFRGLFVGRNFRLHRKRWAGARDRIRNASSNRYGSGHRIPHQECHTAMQHFPVRGTACGEVL